MSQDNQVVITSYFISNYDGEGYHYAVYSKDDYERKRKIYSGRISIDGKHLDCTCKGWSLLQKCYHGTNAIKTMEVPID